MLLLVAAASSGDGAVAAAAAAAAGAGASSIHNAGGGAKDISVLGVGLAAALIVVQALVSLRLHLGLHSQLAVAAVRCVVQLSVLGYILVPIFNVTTWWPVLLYAAFMVLISALEAMGRPAKVYNGMFLHVLLSIAVVASAVMAYGLLLVIGVAPWWEPQYLIPLLGMLLGNTISGISIGLAAVIEELSSGGERVERLLALGASRSEATRELLSRSVRLAMTPLLNQMSVVGIVSIPGMMTGQILSGGRPDQAARYQMVIMFLLGAASTAGAVASTSAAVYHVLDGCHRLRLERLLPRAKRSGVNGLLTEAAMQVWGALVWAVSGITSCCCPRAAGSDDDANQPLLAAAGGEAGASKGAVLQEQQQPGGAPDTGTSTVAAADGTAAALQEVVVEQQAGSLAADAANEPATQPAAPSAGSAAGVKQHKGGSGSARRKKR